MKNPIDNNLKKSKGNKFSTPVVETSLQKENEGESGQDNLDKTQERELIKLKDIPTYMTGHMGGVSIFKEQIDEKAEKI